MGHKHSVGHDIKQRGVGELDRSSRKEEAILGGEQFEPGKPTRHVPAKHGPLESAGLPSDIEEIARQQGASQRGWTADQKKEKERPAQFDPAHPGGLPSGDPRR